MNLVGIFVCRFLYQVVVELVVFIAADGLQVALGQGNFINLTGLIQLECNVVGLYQSNIDGIKQFALGIPVQWILGEHLFVVLYIGGHGVAAVVPHIFVVHGSDCIWTAQLINHALCHWIHTSIGSYGVKVWFWLNTGVNQRVVILCLSADHFTEFGAFACGKSICLFLAQGLGVFIILFCTFDHFDWHGSVGGVVLMEVEYPLQTGQEVLCGTICFFVAIDVNPFYIVTQVEGPGQTTVFGSPFFCNTWCQLTVGVQLQQRVGQVAQVFKVCCHLAVQDIKGLQFSGRQSGDNQILNLLAGACSCFFVFFLLVFCRLLCFVVLFFLFCAAVFSCSCSPTTA